MLTPGCWQLSGLQQSGRGDGQNNSYSNPVGQPWCLADRPGLQARKQGVRKLQGEPTTLSSIGLSAERSRRWRACQRSWLS